MTPSAMDVLDPWPARNTAYDARFDVPHWPWYGAEEQAAS